MESAETPERTITIVHPPEPTFKEKCWLIVEGLTAVLVLLALGAYIVMLAWNGTTDVTKLPEIDWQDAFAVLWIVHVVGRVFNR